MTTEMNEQELDEHVFDLLNPDERPAWLDYDPLPPLPEHSGTEPSNKRKVPKNDIRRFIPKMFCNVINAGRYNATQIFMDSFVAPDCQLAVFYDVPTYFHFPPQVNATGPLQIGHFMLGNQMMFPDMVVSLAETNITLSPDGVPGSKIYMEVEYNLTKTSHIPIELWVPSYDLIESLYKAQTGWQLTHILRHEHLYRSPSRAIIPTSSSEDVLADVRVHPSVTVSNDSNDGGDGERLSFPSLGAMEGVSSAGSTTSGTCTPNGPPPATVLASAFTLPDRLPVRYAQAMYQAAVPVYQPMALRLRGPMVFMLDASNHIVSIETHLAAV